MTAEQIERIDNFLRRHPFMGFPVRVLFTVLLLVGLPLFWVENKIFPVVFNLFGLLLVLYGAVLFFFWIMGKGEIGIADVARAYLLGQAIRLSVWVLWRRRKNVKKYPGKVS